MMKLKLVAKVCLVLICLCKQTSGRRSEKTKDYSEDYKGSDYSYVEADGSQDVKQDSQKIDANSRRRSGSSNERRDGIEREVGKPNRNELNKLFKILSQDLNKEEVQGHHNFSLKQSPDGLGVSYHGKMKEKLSSEKNPNATIHRKYNIAITSTSHNGENTSTSAGKQTPKTLPKGGNITDLTSLAGKTENAGLSGRHAAVSFSGHTGVSLNSSSPDVSFSKEFKRFGSDYGREKERGAEDTFDSQRKMDRNRRKKKKKKKVVQEKKKEPTKPKFDILLKKIEKVDSHVYDGQRLLKKALKQMRNRMGAIVRKLSSVYKMDKARVGLLMNSTMIAAESEFKHICLDPINKKLKVPRWTSWSEWGTCTLTCGKGGYKLRHRNCKSRSMSRCLGNNFDISPCEKEICPAFWLTWGHWSHCSSSCDHGLRVRTRTCLTSNVKLRCMGSTAEVKDCFDQECPQPLQTRKLQHDEKAFSKTTLYSKHAGKDRSKLNGKVPKETSLAVEGRESSGEYGSRRGDSNPEWSSWTGWSMCRKCGEGSRQRRRICLNKMSNRPISPSFCPGAELEKSPCKGSACSIEREFPTAPHVAQGHAVELKCNMRRGENPRTVFWVTPRSKHIIQHSQENRLFMYGTSLLIKSARFADQGKYRCVLMFEDQSNRISVAPLIVDTCKDQPCLNGGRCLKSSDLEFEGFTHYQCDCPEEHEGSFCEKDSSSNKYIVPIIVSVLCVLLALSLVVFLLLRSKHKKIFNTSPNNKGSPKKGKKNKSPSRSQSRSRSPSRSQSRSRSRSRTPSVVSKDNSFVEVTADDIQDFDQYDMPENSGSGFFGQAGYTGSHLKYPSPKQRLVYNQGSENEEDQYVTMKEIPPSERPSDQETEVPTYENLPYANEGIYETIPDEGTYHETPQTRNPTAEEIIEKAAEEIAQQCLVQIENESQRMRPAQSWSGSQSGATSSPVPSRLQTPQDTSWYGQSPSSRETRSQARPSQKMADARTTGRSPSKKMQDARILPRDYRSPKHDDRKNFIPRSLSVKDKQQEAEFLKHFNVNLVPKMQSPTTSTPVKDQVPGGKPIILPSDILSGNTGKAKRNLTDELMIVTSQSVFSQADHKDGPTEQNFSNNGVVSDIMSQSDVNYETSFHSPDQQSDSSGMRDSFLSAVSTSMRTLPDVDNTITFPRLSNSRSYPQATTLESRDQSWSNALQKNLYPINEGSMYLSDCNYTPEASEHFESQSSNPETSDVDEEGEEEEEEGDEEQEYTNTSGSDTSHATLALRYHPRVGQ